MEKIFERAQMFHLMAMLKVKNFLDDERGDTNFISIIVILAIALLVAGVFIVFKDQIITQATQIIDSFEIK